MNKYNPNDLYSTLEYIKNRFGLCIFADQERITAIFRDLAPEQKNELGMLERLSRSGILKDFVLYTGRSRQEQRRIISKAKTQLIQQLYIMPDVADSYLSIIASVFEWDIGVSTPKSRQTYGKKALYVAVIAVIFCIGGAFAVFGNNESEDVRDKKVVEGAKETRTEDNAGKIKKESVSEKKTEESSNKDKATVDTPKEKNAAANDKKTASTPDNKDAATQHTLPTAVPEEYYYYNGHTYAFYDASRYGFSTYDEVSNFCHEQGGHLAVINDRSENSFLYNLMKENYKITVCSGYTDKNQEGTWVWDGDESHYENWTRSGDWDLPDNGEGWGGGEWKNGGEDYAEYNYDRDTNWGAPNDTTWNDATFMENTTIFFCEWDYDVGEAEEMQKGTY